MANLRNPNYTNDEDRLICSVYLDITGDGEVGNNQTKDQFWTRVANAYNESKTHPSWPDRTFRSVETRIQTITKATAKLKGCIAQVEDLNPSGASEMDIMNMAKQMMMTDPQFKKGYKFEHVWDIVKNFPKFDCPSQKSRADKSSSQPTQSNMYVPESPLSPTTTPLHISDDSGSGSGSQRPLGVKKTKLKKKKDEQVLNLLATLHESTQKMHELFNEKERKKAERFEKKITEQQKFNTNFERDSEHKLMMMDINSIEDPVSRLYFENERKRVAAKQAASLVPPHHDDNFNYQDYFPDMGGSNSGTGLGDF